MSENCVYTLPLWSMELGIFWFSDYSIIWIFNYLNIQLSEYSIIWIFNYLNIQLSEYSIIYFAYTAVMQLRYCDVYTPGSWFWYTIRIIQCIQLPMWSMELGIFRIFNIEFLVYNSDNSMSHLCGIVCILITIAIYSDNSSILPCNRFKLLHNWYGDGTTL